ncbi:MAG: prepilin-type cleavage/methylation domain-containing protein [Gemmatimonadetes bacterium]|nr:prepilin-type cleavage/methylation domain-containing protein [Gemmatimonadota bacterium]
MLEMMIVSVILGTLAALALPRLNEALHRAQVARAVAEVKMVEIELYDHWSEKGALPTSLTDIGRGTLMDPWGRPYRYLRIAGGDASVGEFRKDRFLVPLNSDFDLFSMGRDGRSQSPLSAATSQDDVVRANDGSFVGLASEY